MGLLSLDLGEAGVFLGVLSFIVGFSKDFGKFSWFGVFSILAIFELKSEKIMGFCSKICALSSDKLIFLRSEASRCSDFSISGLGGVF